MRKTNIVLMIVLILMLAVVVLYWLGGSLVVSATRATANATDYTDAFNEIAGVLDSGAAPKRFVGDVPTDPTGYSLVDITVTLENRGIFAAEWTDVTVTPASGDVAVYSMTGTTEDIDPQSSGEINLKLLTKTPTESRTLTISYYVLGMKRSLQIGG